MESPSPLPDFSTPEWDKVFKSLLFDLSRNKCVLLIGPEIVRQNGKILGDVLHEQLQSQHTGDIAYYHERDELYLFANKTSKSEVQRTVSLFYEEAKPDGEIFENIARLPFALTISTNPDHFLLRAFPGNVKPGFAFFHHKGDNGDEALRNWERDTPLVYNLCGSFEEDASLVLDYDDLFKLLKTALGTPGLPDKIRRVLADAKSFFFLGFDFDKWYSQLLLRLLCEDNAPTNIALNTQFGDTDNHTFLLKQFNINFIGEGDDFFAELCRRWQEQQNEGGGAAEKQDKHLVLKLLKEGKTARSLEILMTLITAPEDKDMAMMVSNWYHKWENDTKAGTEDSRNLETLYNRVVKNINDLATNLPD